MPLFWVSLAFLLGVLLAASLPLPTAAWLGLAGLALPLPFLTRISTFLVSRFPILQRLRLPRLPGRLAQSIGYFTQKLPRIPILIPYSLLPLFLLLGASRYQAAQPRLTPASLAWYNDQLLEVELEGVLVRPPDVRDTYANLRLRVESLRRLDAEQPIEVDGLLLARASAGGGWAYGDRLRLTGRLLTPSEDESFSYRDYLARSGVYSYLAYPQISRLAREQGNPLLAALYAFHDRAVDTIYRIFPDPEASLMAGIMLGEPQGIPAQVQADFRLTGTSHIIAISGFNITLVASLFTTIFSRLLGRRRGAVSAAIGIGLFVLLVGASAAVVRAALFGWLTLLGRQVGRRQSGLNSLAFTGALMALHNPLVLWDGGFQLSFAATLGLMLYAEPFTTAFGNWAGRWLPPAALPRLTKMAGEYLLTTLAAQVTLLPVILALFEQFPLTSLLVNPLILPAQPPLMLLGGLALGLGLIYPPLGQAAAALAWPFTAYTIRAVELFARVPGGVIHTGAPSALFVVGFYAVLFAITFARPHLVGLVRRLTPAAIVMGVALLAVITWRAALHAPDGRMHVTLLEAGNGEAVLIQTPTGRYVLVNGGPSPSGLSDALGRRLPMGNRRLDWLVVADPDNEDLSALPSTLERYPPDNVLWAGPTGGTYAARSLWQSLSAADIPVRRLQAGATLDLGAGTRLHALTVGSRGAVFLLEWHSFRMLLPLGLDFEALDTLEEGKSIGRVSAILLAQSGYAPLNPPEWIAALHPQVVLFSVAAGNAESLPSMETLTAVEGYTLLRTDENGWIELTTDGERMWAEVESR
jgi:competence protein ComEC